MIYNAKGIQIISKFPVNRIFICVEIQLLHRRLIPGFTKAALHVTYFSPKHHCHLLLASLPSCMTYLLYLHHGKWKAYSAKMKRLKEKCKSQLGVCDTFASFCVHMCLCVCASVLSINWWEGCHAFHPTVSYLDNELDLPEWNKRVEALILNYSISVSYLIVLLSLTHSWLSHKYTLCMSHSYPVSFHGGTVCPYENVSQYFIELSIMLYICP